MAVRGRVKDGVVVFENGGALPEGTEVEVRRVAKRRKTKTTKVSEPTAAERFAGFIGKAKSLPPDMARNHDHYLYGASKRRA